MSPELDLSHIRTASADNGSDDIEPVFSSSVNWHLDGDWGSVVSLAASSPDVAATIAMWQPSRLPDDQIEWLKPHLERIRRWVVAAAPQSEAYARVQLHAASRALLAADEAFGVTDDESLLNPNSLNELVAYGLPDVDDGSKLTLRSALWAIGRAVNPDLFEPVRVPLRVPEVKPAYDAIEERNLRIAARLPGYRTAAERRWTVAGSCGAGLSAPELLRAETCDLVKLAGERIAVQVRGARERLVPIRAEYTALAFEAVDRAQQSRFFSARGANAVYDAASRLCGGLSLRRTRSTWVAAHLRAGTNPVVLRVIAGGVSEKTLRELSARIEAELAPHDAALQGLRA